MTGTDIGMSIYRFLESRKTLEVLHIGRYGAKRVAKVRQLANYCGRMPQSSMAFLKAVLAVLTRAIRGAAW
jgi:hypothetical protein